MPMAPSPHLELRMSIDDDLLISRLGNDDLDAYVELYAECFGARIDRDFVSRKTGRSMPNRLSNGFIFTIKDRRSGELAAALSYFPRHFARNDQKLLCVEAGDAMVSHNYRGRSLFQKLITASLEEIKQDGILFIYGFPNSAASPTWRKTDVLFVHRVRQAIFPLSPAAVLAQRLPSFAFAAPMVAMLHRGFVALSDVGFRHSLKWEIRPDVADAIADCPPFLPAGRLRRDEDLEFLKWRYTWGNSYGARFRCVIVRNLGEICAVFVLKLLSGSRVEIFDLKAYRPDLLPDSIAVLRRQALPDLARTERTNFTLLAYKECSNMQGVIPAFRRAGFLVRTTDSYVIMQSLDSAHRELANIDQWWITAADTDAT